MQKKGTVLLIVVCLLLSIIVSISLGLSLTYNRAMQNQHFADYSQCLLLADSGIERARYKIRHDSPPPSVGTSETWPFFGGQFNIVFIAAAPSCTTPYRVSVTSTYPVSNPRSTITIFSCMDASSNLLTYDVSGG